ncbi:MAG: NAD(P)-binding domain-containing protein [Alphaproteobacteria bacterium]
MAFDPIVVAAYAGPLAIIWLIYFSSRKKAEKSNLAARAEAVEAGLTEPASLHPLIDPSKCLGCGSCIRACPEGEIIGFINGKAELIEPTECIGHGACKTACPHGAITLVFGTETRGVDIPNVAPNFETNVPGIFIAGELGGMGLVRNAIEQGRQAIDSIRQVGRSNTPGVADVLIIGAGPAGISASLAAIEHKMRYITLEQDSFGGTVAHFPRGKLVMTQPATLPLYGKMKFTEITKEKLLGFWNFIARRTGLKVHYGERVEMIAPAPHGFDVQTTQGLHKTRTVLLAIGRRGTPRRLEVPGEEQAKVVYRLIDPEQYRGKHVLVVGGGDSALEAAGSIAEEQGTTVTLSYRNEAFSRAKPKNRQRVERAQAAKRLKVMLKSNVKEIGPDTARLEWKGQPVEIPNDAVIICAGGILPTKFLKSIGIEVETKYGTA